MAVSPCNISPLPPAAGLLAWLHADDAVSAGGFLHHGWLHPDDCVGQGKAPQLPEGVSWLPASPLTYPALRFVGFLPTPHSTPNPHLISLFWAEAGTLPFPPLQHPTLESIRLTLKESPPDHFFCLHPSKLHSTCLSCSWFIVYCPQTTNWRLWLVSFWALKRVFILPAASVIHILNDGIKLKRRAVSGDQTLFWAESASDEEMILKPLNV